MTIPILDEAKRRQQLGKCFPLVDVPLQPAPSRIGAQPVSMQVNIPSSQHASHF